MATSLNSLYDSIEEVAVFAENIGSGKLSVEFKSKGNGDILGNSLIKMREGLVKADEEAKLRKMEDEKQSWIERSVANFGKELRNEHGDTKSFYNNIIRIIVRDLEVNQAALYLINDNDESNKFFEVVACMAWGREKMQKKTFMLEEGLLGACYFEREPIVLTEIPEDYVSITSGLGGANPKVLMLVPLIYNENVIGVVEVASFKVLEDHKKTYLLHVSEIFASTLVSIRVNARTNELLSISQMQAEEMAAQEEEMRQNLEELHATQEEMKRKTQKAELMQQAVEESFISITIDRQLSVVHSNAIGASIIGENALSVAGINLESLVVESDREALRAAVGAALAGRIETVGLTFKGRQGSRHIQATLVAEQEMNSHITIIGYEVR
jgi:PAS domain-containing protein